MELNAWYNVTPTTRTLECIRNFLVDCKEHGFHLISLYSVNVSVNYFLFMLGYSCVKHE